MKANELQGRLLLVLSLVAAAPVFAQNQGLVVRDGSLGAGAAGVVPRGTDPLGRAADYLITPDQGSQVGQNLFHSFERFGIGPGETATFTGPDPLNGPQSVHHILSRVTGGEVSEIRGTLRSTVPGASVYLINPTGVVFGEGAALDVPSGFYATTADRIQLGQEGTFESDLGGNPSTLVVSDPEAFGFLSTRPAPITVAGGRLQVGSGQQLGLIGGDLSIQGSANGGFVSAPGGDVQLVSVASPGRVSGLAEPGAPLVLEGFAAFGTVRLTGGAIVDTSSVSPTFRADMIFTVGELLFPPSGIPLASIEATDAPLPNDIVLRVRFSEDGRLPDGRLVVLRPRTLDVSAGSISVRSGDLLVTEDSELRTLNLGPGRGRIDLALSGSLVVAEAGEVSARTGLQLNAVGDRILLFDGFLVQPPATFSLVAGGAGGGGDIDVAATSIVLHDGSRIAASSFGAGRGGQVTLTASESIEMSGRSQDEQQTPTGIFSNAQGTGDGGDIIVEAAGLSIEGGAGIFNQTTGDADAGDITVNVATLEIGADSQIDSSTSGQSLGDNPDSAASGKGGQITITATDSILLSGLPPEDKFGQISTGTGFTPRSNGDAGRIHVETPLLEIRDGAGISVTTRGAGASGEITIDANRILLSGGSEISARSTAQAEDLTPDVITEGPGDAGFIRINFTENLELESSAITTLAEAAGGGGILINGDGIGVTADGKLIAEKKPDQVKGLLVRLVNSQITTRVEQGAGGGGDVLIDPIFIILDSSTITTSAADGNGGNILLVADTVFSNLPLNQALNAESQTGVDGVVDINAPDVDVAGNLAALSDSTLDASDRVSPPCSARRHGETAGSFVVAGRQGLPPGPEGMLDTWPGDAGTADGDAAGPRIALAGTCRN